MQKKKLIDNLMTFHICLSQIIDVKSGEFDVFCNDESEADKLFPIDYLKQMKLQNFRAKIFDIFLFSSSHSIKIIFGSRHMENRCICNGMK